MPKAEIATNGYDLRLNRYKEVVHGQAEHGPPPQILATLEELEELEAQIHQGMKELKELLS